VDLSQSVVCGLLQVINVIAGKRLAELAPAAVEPLLAEGYDHHNLEACPEYIPRLRKFLQQLAHSKTAAVPGTGEARAAAGIAPHGPR
jgi:hypothetical protein